MRREEYPKCLHCADGRMANNQGGSIWCDRCESPTAIAHATTVLPPHSIDGQPYHACGDVYFERIENRDGHGDVRLTFKWPDGTIEREEQIPSFIWESAIALMSANGSQAYESAIEFHRGRMGTRSQSDELLIAGLRDRIEELELQVHALDSPCETCNGSGSIERSR